MRQYKAHAESYVLGLFNATRQRRAIRHGVTTSRVIRLNISYTCYIQGTTNTDDTAQYGLRELPPGEF